MHSLLLAALVSLFISPNAKPQSIPAEFLPSGRVVVTAVVNGKPMRLHLDSGSGMILIDNAAARTAGLPGTNGTAAATVDVGAFHAENAPIVVAPYGREMAELHLSGILGAPFFESNVVTIDYPHKRVIVAPRASFDPSATNTKATALVELYRGLATVPVWVDGARARMLLDTGSAQTLVFRGFADRVGLNWPVKTVNYCTYGEKCFTTDQYVTGPIVVGTTEFRKAFVDVPVQPLLSPKYYDGILGRDVLQQFVVTFDYADNAVYFSLPQ